MCEPARVLASSAFGQHSYSICSSQCGSAYGIPAVPGNCICRTKVLSDMLILKPALKEYRTSVLKRPLPDFTKQALTGRLEKSSDSISRRQRLLAKSRPNISLFR